jgi:hypothetical protein
MRVRDARVPPEHSESESARVLDFASESVLTITVCVVAWTAVGCDTAHGGESAGARA